MSRVGLSWAAVPRCAAAVVLSLIAVLAWASSSFGQQPAAAPGGAVTQTLHRVRVDYDREGATLEVTRSIHNHGPVRAEAKLEVGVPCSAAIDGLAVQERDAGGQPRWRDAELLDPAEAQARWLDYLAGPARGVAAAADADTAAAMSRSPYLGCAAKLAIYPVPPLATRTLRYRVFVPSAYAEGSHRIELPALTDAELPATLDIAPPSDPSMRVSLDGQALGPGGATVSGAEAHTLVLDNIDPAPGRARLAELDLDALVAQSPAAQARLEQPLEQASLGHAARADLELPVRLASVPAVRRVVVVLDVSRSLEAYEREWLTTLAAAYLDKLAEPQAQVEVLLFARQLERLFYEFVPADTAAAQLRELEVETHNGSEAGRALLRARELLRETPAEGPGADWILLLSDLELRRSFSVEALSEQLGGPRIHVVRAAPAELDFGPAPVDDPWAVLARNAGGMAWIVDDPLRSRSERWAQELVAPTTIWNLSLELELGDGSHLRESLERSLAAGAARSWTRFDHQGAAIERASFVGEVWGQRRAWSATPSAEAGLRLAGALATRDESYRVPKAARVALAHYAGVVSGFTSAWALARFDGPAAAPVPVEPTFGRRGRRLPVRHSCGGGHASYKGPRCNCVSIDALAQQVLDRCPRARNGSFSFETSDEEILDVHGPGQCIEARGWKVDLRDTGLRGHNRVSVAYRKGKVDAVQTVRVD